MPVVTRSQVQRNQLQMERNNTFNQQQIERTNRFFSEMSNAPEGYSTIGTCGVTVFKPTRDQFADMMRQHRENIESGAQREMCDRILAEIRQVGQQQQQ